MLPTAETTFRPGDAGYEDELAGFPDGVQPAAGADRRCDRRRGGALRPSRTPPSTGCRSACRPPGMDCREPPTAGC